MKLKFRAWDKKENKFASVASLVVVRYGSHDDKTRYYGFDDYENRFVLMQYTGLHDKNLIDIYEGDILELDGGAEPFKVEVIFSDGAFRAKVPWLKEDYPPLLAYTIFEDLEEGKFFKDCVIVKVIGNIYQNPELLKEGV